MTVNPPFQKRLLQRDDIEVDRKGDFHKGLYDSNAQLASELKAPPYEVNASPEEGFTST